MKNLPSYKASGSDQSSGGKKVNVKWSCIQDVLNTKKTEYADELALGFKRKSGIRNIPQVNSDMGNPQWLSGKESTCNQGNAGLIPRWERSPGEGNGIPLQCSCLGNPRDRGVQGVAKGLNVTWWVNDNSGIVTCSNVKYWNREDWGWLHWCE